MAYGIVYLLVNAKNGKEYVGQTICTLEKRWARHRWDCTLKRVRMAITAAISKYGEEAFERSVLCECQSQSELDKMEVYYIKERSTLSPNGYNLSMGGNGKGKMSEESKRKVSEANKGRVFTKVHREKLSKSHMGQTISEKERQRRRDFMKGKQPNAEALANSIKSCSKTYLVELPDGEETEVTNMAQYCRENRLSTSKMSQLSTGKRKTYKGYKVSPIMNRVS